MWRDEGPGEGVREKDREEGRNERDGERKTERENKRERERERENPFEMQRKILFHALSSRASAAVLCKLFEKTLVSLPVGE